MEEICTKTCWFTNLPRQWPHVQGLPDTSTYAEGIHLKGRSAVGRVKNEEHPPPLGSIGTLNTRLLDDLMQQVMMPDGRNTQRTQQCKSDEISLAKCQYQKAKFREILSIDV